MQLQLTIAERRLLADVLTEKSCSLMRGTTAQQLLERRSKARECDDLIAKIFDNQLQFSADELDLLTAALNEFRQDQQEQSDQQRRLLESLTEKITEACVMI